MKPHPFIYFNGEMSSDHVAWSLQLYVSYSCSRVWEGAIRIKSMTSSRKANYILLAFNLAVARWLRCSIVIDANTLKSRQLRAAHLSIKQFTVRWSTKIIFNNILASSLSIYQCKSELQGFNYLWAGLHFQLKFISLSIYKGVEPHGAASR